MLTQHQDCQGTVIQAAKAAGKYVVGYHYDAEALDPSGWLTGSAWDWAPVYEKIIKTAARPAPSRAASTTPTGSAASPRRQPA